MEELYYLQVAQIFILLDGLAYALCDDAHLHVELHEFEQSLEKIFLQHCSFLIGTDHNALR